MRHFPKDAQSRTSEKPFLVKVFLSDDVNIGYKKGESSYERSSFFPFEWVSAVKSWLKKGKLPQRYMPHFVFETIYSNPYRYCLRYRPYFLDFVLLFFSEHWKSKGSSQKKESPRFEDSKGKSGAHSKQVHRQATKGSRFSRLAGEGNKVWGTLERKFSPFHEVITKQNKTHFTFWVLFMRLIEISFWLLMADPSTIQVQAKVSPKTRKTPKTTGKEGTNYNNNLIYPGILKCIDWLVLIGHQYRNSIQKENKKITSIQFSITNLKSVNYLQRICGADQNLIIKNQGLPNTFFRL